MEWGLALPRRRKREFFFLFVVSSGQGLLPSQCAVIAFS